MLYFVLVPQDVTRNDYLCSARLLRNCSVFATSVVNVQYRKEEFSLNEVATATVTALADSTEVIHNEYVRTSNNEVMR